MIMIDPSTMKRAENDKLLKAQILAELRNIPGLNMEWLNAVEQFLNSVGGDVLLHELTKNECGSGGWTWKESTRIQEILFRKFDIKEGGGDD